LGKVIANPDYVATMQRLVTASASRSDYWDRFKRWYNKRRGLPATADIAIIGALISEMKQVTEMKLSHTLSNITLVSPRVKGLSREDLADALKYARVATWEYRLDTAEAVYVANGNGICPPEEDCDDDDYPWPMYRYLSVGFNNDSLSTSVIAIHRAYFAYERFHRFDFDAGLHALSQWSKPAEFWKHVRTRIVALPRAIQDDPDLLPFLRQKFDRVQIHGEQVHNLTFLETLKDALVDIAGIYSNTNELVGPSTTGLTHQMSDPEFAAARGAAFYSRARQQLGWGCLENRTACDEERRREKEKSCTRLMTTDGIFKVEL
jgi:hypothetical protein